MKPDKFSKAHNKRKMFITLALCFGLIISPLIAASHFIKPNLTEVQAANYSGGSSGFSRGSDGSITATFTVTDNDLDMKGWLLCLFTSKPSIDSNNKLNGSNDIHPYSYSSVSHYFFASNTTKTGSITVTWSASAGDQKTSWSASTSTGASGKTLKDYIDNGTNWHLVIGPRHYNTGWGNSGIGAGTDGYWENCDYYIGPYTEVFPSSDKDMSVSVTNYQGTYDNANHSINVKVNTPSSGYTIKYRTSSSGSYNLTSNPSYKDAGNYTVYFQVTASGYNSYSGSGTVKISKASPTYTIPTAKTGLVYNGSSQALVNAGSSNILYSLNGSSYSSSVPSATDAGTYTVYYKVEESTNYTGYGPQSFTVTISKASPIYTAPSAKTNLVYNGENQELVSGGSSNILYSLDNNSYSSSVPTAKNAGTYVVYYKIEESSNYTGFGPENIEISISKADASYVTTPAARLGLNYIGESQALISEGASTGGTVLYSLDNLDYSTNIPEKTLVGEYTVYYKIEGDSNYNGVEASSFVVSISPNDKTALNEVIDSSHDYLDEISSTYEDIANLLDEKIFDAELVSEDDNQTV